MISDTSNRQSHPLNLTSEDANGRWCPHQRHFRPRANVLNYRWRTGCTYSTTEIVLANYLQTAIDMGVTSGGTGGTRPPPRFFGGDCPPHFWSSSLGGTVPPTLGWVVFLSSHSFIEAAEEVFSLRVFVHWIQVLRSKYIHLHFNLSWHPASLTSPRFLSTKPEKPAMATSKLGDFVWIRNIVVSVPLI